MRCKRGFNLHQLLSGLTLLTMTSRLQGMVDISSMCTVLRRTDCASQYMDDSNEVLCASDDLTYSNMCFFSQVKCDHHHLSIVHFGPCDTATTQPPTTAAATTPAHVGEWTMLLRVFCDPAAPVNCRLYPAEPVCGSDLLLYYNKCELLRASCSTDVTQQEMAVCHAHYGHTLADHLDALLLHPDPSNALHTGHSLLRSEGPATS